MSKCDITLPRNLQFALARMDPALLTTKYAGLLTLNLISARLPSRIPTLPSRPSPIVMANLVPRSLTRRAADLMGAHRHPKLV